MKKVYLSGPMSGKAHFNFPVFDEAARNLRAMGMEVFNPADRDRERDGKDWGILVPDGDPKKATAMGFNLRAALADDMRFICLEADAIALLPGWEGSSGARAERAVASALKLEEIIL